LVCQQCGLCEMAAKDEKTKKELRKVVEGIEKLLSAEQRKTK